MLDQLVYKVIELELLCSLISPERVMSLADEQIIESDEPDDVLLDLCIAKSEDRQFKILGALGSNNENEAFELVATELFKKYDSGVSNFLETTRKLLVMHYHSSKLEADTAGFMYGLMMKHVLLLKA